jgi:hypothetical protein
VFLSAGISGHLDTDASSGGKQTCFGAHSDAQYSASALLRTSKCMAAAFQQLQQHDANSGGQAVTPALTIDALVLQSKAAASQSVSDRNVAVSFSVDLIKGSSRPAGMATIGWKPALATHHVGTVDGIAADVQTSLQPLRQVQTATHQASLHVQTTQLAPPRARAAKAQRSQSMAMGVQSYQSASEEITTHSSSAVAHGPHMISTPTDVQGAVVPSAILQAAQQPLQKVANTQAQQRYALPFVAEHIVLFLSRPYTLLLNLRTRARGAAGMIEHDRLTESGSSAAGANGAVDAKADQIAFDSCGQVDCVHQGHAADENGSFACVVKAATVDAEVRGDVPVQCKSSVVNSGEDQSYRRAHDHLAPDDAYGPASSNAAGAADSKHVAQCANDLGFEINTDISAGGAPHVQHNGAASTLPVQLRTSAGVSSHWQTVLDILNNAGPQQVPTEPVSSIEGCGQGSIAPHSVSEEHPRAIAKDVAISKSKRKRNKRRATKQ